MAEAAPRETAGGFPVERINAILIADQIADIILTQRPQLAGAIFARRLARETFVGIAKAESNALQEIGAKTDAVRFSVVQRVCNSGLASELGSRVKSEIRSRMMRKRPFNPEGQAKAAKATRIHEWTNEDNAELVRLAETMLHRIGSHTGMPDWKSIAEIMNDRSKTSFTAAQWRGRFQHLQKYNPATPAADQENIR